jgi:hypothetical protein
MRVREESRKAYFLLRHGSTGSPTSSTGSLTSDGRRMPSAIRQLTETEGPPSISRLPLWSLIRNVRVVNSCPFETFVAKKKESHEYTNMVGCIMVASTSLSHPAPLHQLLFTLFPADRADLRRSFSSSEQARQLGGCTPTSHELTSTIK